MLIELAQEVLQFRLDVILFSILLNVYVSDEGSMIANVLPDFHRITTEPLSTRTSSSITTAATWLQITLEDLSHILVKRVLELEARDTPQILLAFRDREE